MNGNSEACGVSVICRGFDLRVDRLGVNSAAAGRRVP
jgi:hypothetical protein